MDCEYEMDNKRSFYESIRGWFDFYDLEQPMYHYCGRFCGCESDELVRFNLKKNKQIMKSFNTLTLDTNQL